MNRKQRFLPLLAGICLLAIGVWWYRYANAPTAVERVSAVDRSQQEQAWEAPSPVPHASSRLASPLVTVTTEDPEAYERAQGKGSSTVAQAGRTKLQGQYQTEAVDAGWAIGKERALETLQSNDQIEQFGARPVALDVACRSSVCRLQAEFASRVAADDWITLYLLNAGHEISRSSYLRTDYPDGTASIELYGQTR